MARHFGDTYTWLLYGDDDTLFFTDAVLGVLDGLDADMPYFLTGARCEQAGASLAHSHAAHMVEEMPAVQQTPLPPQRTSRIILASQSGSVRPATL